MADRVSTAVSPEEARFNRDRQKIKETDFVLDCLEKGDRYLAPLRPMWREMEENRLVASPSARRAEAVPYIGSTNFSQTVALTSGRNPRRIRSRLKDPESSQIADTNLAQAMTLLMSSPDYMEVIPVGSDDPEKAKYVSRILMGLLQAPGNYRTIYGTLDHAYSFGTGIVEIGWETLTRLQTVLRPIIDPDTGMKIGREADVAQVIYRDHPLMKNVDRFDFWTDPSGTRIHDDMQWVIKRFRISKARALEMGEAGIYNLNDVRQAIQSVSTQNSRGDDRGDQRLQEVSRETATAYGMMTGFECWCIMPFSPSGGGARNRLITLLEGTHVRSVINPYIDGNFPFVEIVPNPIPGRFDGFSPLEAVRFLQDKSDALLMGTTDAYDLAWRNVLLKGRTFQGDPNRLAERRPNDVIDCGDPNSIVPLPIDIGSLTAATQELIRNKQDMRDVGGSNAPQLPTSGRSTATEISEIVRLASQKTEMSVQLIERNDLPRLGGLLFSRIKQFLDPEREAILAGERFPLTLDDIDFEADIRFVGSRQAMSKAQKIAAKREAINVLGTNPEILRMLPTLVQAYFEEDLSIKNANQVIQEAIRFLDEREQRAAELQLQTGVQGGSTGGTPVAGASSQETFGTQAGETEREGQRVA